MRFISTRGGEFDISSSKAIINGISSDGGLYVPEEFPNLYEKIKNKKSLKYEEISFEIIKEFFTDFTFEEIKFAVDKAYKSRFKVIEENGFLELYHGPTAAFKDAALLFLPQIMKLAKEKENISDEIIILAATSGDTGKAALEGFCDVDGFKVLVYYPNDGVSPVQKMQMLTQKGSNVKVVGIKGNFDEAQSGVKEMFGDNELKKRMLSKGVRISSANSINIGRLIPQIIYYYYGYFQLVNKQKIKLGDKINVSVPTGNFGNILAAYYAKEMGLPIAKFICASNENKVLADFFDEGIYDKRRELILTESPSMDILVSSNLERLLFEASGRDSNETKKLMNELEHKGVYSISEKSKEFLNNFYGNYANTKEVYKAIKDLYEKEGYLIDTHTAVAYVVLKKYIKFTGDTTPYLISSTASPYKFSRSITNALEIDTNEDNDFEVIKRLNEFCGINIPTNLKNLDKKKVLHNNICSVNNMRQVLEEFVGENIW
ncbi:MULTISPECIES: threonine synthase [Clostridium]|jgi:threonine synthase|uniref:threonine synthase n=1 Tax=Clostridium TaxID=1485 RepID=UPI00115B1F35|nr:MULTISPECIES: threonine synthase [Clostridium]MBS5305013.1 threonine synthase [Clostridium sp.]MDB1932287.1 threonine synthase [Clostridium tertium]MDB1936439.1 threonine synthase [Clostridium tertium]MDB1942981.1 threonine synthase [Clostridium tertium]MDB1950082.1 threonine synthase [Clostridium tertium]